MASSDTAAVRPIAPVAQGSNGASLDWAWRGLKVFLALAALPACLGFSEALYPYFWTWKAELRIAVIGVPAEFKWFLGGLFGVLLYMAVSTRPTRFYVLAHELVHAMATWLCLGKVSNLKASATGGQVTTSKTNTFIRLAPYFVPLYVVLAVGIFAGLDAWWRPLGDYRWVLAGVLGAGFCFHACFTVISLKLDQPDLKADGWFFSLVLIYFLNVLILAGILGMALTGKLSGAWDALSGVWRMGVEQSGELYRNLWSNLRSLLGR